MADSITQFVLPNLLFFVTVFLAFSILESVIVLFLLWLEEKNRDRIMIFMLKVYRHYRRIQSVFQIAGVILGLVALWAIWTFLRPAAGRPEITIFAVLILLAITLVYFILTHLKGRLSLKKRGDRILYFVLSLVLYLFILVLINQKFPDYRHFVVTEVLNPTVTRVEKTLETNKENSLLNEFRAMARNGQCPVKDYRRERKTDFVHNFAYKATDPEFQIKTGAPVPGDLNVILKGRNCTNGKETFQLTDYGKWYQVIDTKKEAVPAPQN